MGNHSMGFKESAERVLIWAAFAMLTGLKGKDIARVAVAAPIGEKLLRLRLEDAIPFLAEELGKTLNEQRLQFGPAPPRPRVGHSLDH